MTRPAAVSSPPRPLPRSKLRLAQAVPIPTLDRPSTYTLQKGEWPICIARRYDVNLNDLFNLNGLNMESRPAMGAVLKTAFRRKLEQQRARQPCLA